MNSLPSTKLRTFSKGYPMLNQYGEAIAKANLEGGPHHRRLGHCSVQRSWLGVFNPIQNMEPGLTETSVPQSKSQVYFGFMSACLRFGFKIQGVGFCLWLGALDLRICA